MIQGRAVGPTVYRHACALGLEGIVSKLKDSPDRSGRDRALRKVKCAEAKESQRERLGRPRRPA